MAAVEQAGLGDQVGDIILIGGTAAHRQACAQAVAANSTRLLSNATETLARQLLMSIQWDSLSTTC